MGFLLKIKHHIFKYSWLADEIQIIDKLYIYLLDGSYIHFPAAIKSGSWVQSAGAVVAPSIPLENVWSCAKSAVGVVNAATVVV